MRATGHVPRGANSRHSSSSPSSARRCLLSAGPPRSHLAVTPPALRCPRARLALRPPFSKVLLSKSPPSADGLQACLGPLLLWPWSATTAHAPRQRALGATPLCPATSSSCQPECRCRSPPSRMCLPPAQPSPGPQGVQCQILAHPPALPPLVPVQRTAGAEPHSLWRHGRRLRLSPHRLWRRHPVHWRGLSRTCQALGERAHLQFCGGHGGSLARLCPSLCPRGQAAEATLLLKHFWP